MRYDRVSGKETTGDRADGQHREKWLPRDFEAIINRYVQERDLEDDDHLRALHGR